MGRGYVPIVPIVLCNNVRWLRRIICIFTYDLSGMAVYYLAAANHIPYLLHIVPWRGPLPASLRKFKCKNATVFEPTSKSNHTKLQLTSTKTVSSQFHDLFSKTIIAKPHNPT